MKKIQALLETKNQLHERERTLRLMLEMVNVGKKTLTMVIGQASIDVDADLAEHLLEQDIADTASMLKATDEKVLAVEAYMESL